MNKQERALLKGYKNDENLKALYDKMTKLYMSAAPNQIGSQDDTKYPIMSDTIMNKIRRVSNQISKYIEKNYSTIIGKQ